MVRAWWGVVLMAGVVSAAGVALAAPPAAKSLALELRTRVETPPASGVFVPVAKAEEWSPVQTAIIVCDMWDKHWCQGASRRVAEIAPRMNDVLTNARARGVLIIHAPSSCMEPYQDTPARKRAQSAPRAADLPKDIANWCHKIPAEEKGVYPLDQSDGGCDCQPHCPHGSPWRRQVDTIAIKDEDAVSDSGVEIWNLLAQRKITNVIVMGVHTNMCVLGRPFGLRQLAQNGKRVVLMRDMTDTMYNHESWPFVNHFRGTDLIVEHVEKHVCPTITSNQLLGAEPFRFGDDRRPHVVFVIGEDEYDTKTTLPAFARDELEPLGLRATFVHATDEAPNDFAGIEALPSADLMVLSVRRRTPKAEQLAVIKNYLAAGKPLVAIRTSSHAFAPRDKQPPPAGHAAWPELDQEVLGGNYHGHYGAGDKNGPHGEVRIEAAKHPILAGLPKEPFATASWLYKTGPLAAGTTLLLSGQPTGDKTTEAVAWTNTHRGGRVFYTALGHPADFRSPHFRRLLRNAVLWGVDQPIQEKQADANAKSPPKR